MKPRTLWPSNANPRPLSSPARQLFSDVAYKARDRDDLIAGIDEFLDEVIVLPPGEWDPKIRIEPPKKVTPADKRWEVRSLRELRALANNLRTDLS